MLLKTHIDMFQVTHKISPRMHKLHFSDDYIFLCDHSNETSLAVLGGSTCISLEFCYLALLGVQG